MTVVTNQKGSFKLYNVSYIDRLMDATKSKLYEVDLAIEHIKNWPNGLSPEEVKQKLVRLGHEREEICTRISKLKQEESRVTMLGSRRLECERAMREAEREIDQSKDSVFAIRLEWLHLHSKCGTKQTHSIDLVCGRFNRLYDAVKSVMTDEIAKVSYLSEDFDEKMSMTLRSRFDCHSHSACRQHFEDIKSCKRDMISSLDEYAKAYTNHGKIVSEERAAYSRISQEYKIEP